MDEPAKSAEMEERVLHSDLEMDEAITEMSRAITGSAPRRTLLAAERTYLAWLRTGLAALGLALAIGRLLPAVLGGSHGGYGLLGMGYAVFGVLLIAYGLLRARRLEKALALNGGLTFDWWAMVVITGFGLVLGVATVALILTQT